MKKILASFAVMSIIAVIVFNLNLNTQKDTESLLTLANTEALAGENNNTTTLYKYPCKSGDGSQCIPYNGTSSPETCSEKRYC